MLIDMLGINIPHFIARIRPGYKGTTLTIADNTAQGLVTDGIGYRYSITLPLRIRETDKEEKKNREMAGNGFIFENL